jgi:hypothetical protein
VKPAIRAVLSLGLPVNLTVNDDAGAILYQLQRTTKLYRLVKFPFADRSRLSIVKGNHPFWKVLNG